MRIEVRSVEGNSLVPLDQLVCELVPTRCAIIPRKFLNEALSWGGYGGGAFEPFALSADEYNELIKRLQAAGWFREQRRTPEWIQNAGEWCAWNGVCSEGTIEAFRAIQPAYDAMMAEMTPETLARYREAQERFRELLIADDPESPLLETP